MSQELKLKIAGLWNSPNNWSEVPEGALSEATNCVITDKSVIKPRRGFNTIATALGGTPNQFINFGSELLVQYGADGLAYFSSPLWNAIAGSFEPPTARLKGMESNKNLYLSTTTGIKKIESVGLPYRQAGVARALDPIVFDSVTSGWLANNQSVRYRIVFGYKDANNNLILGAPSNSAVFTNTSGSSTNPGIQTRLPESVTDDFFIQVYRSFGVPSTATPNDELQLAAEQAITSTDVTNGEVTVIDTTEESYLGVALYTNPSQEGIENSNFEPPLCWDLALFKGYGFYANTTQKSQLEVTLQAVGLDDLNWYARTCDFISGNNAAVISDLTNIRVGMRVVSPGYVPDETYVTSIFGGSIVMSNDATTTSAGQPADLCDTITINGVRFFASQNSDDPNEFEVYTSGSPSENVSVTTSNFIKAVNRSDSDTGVYAFRIDSSDGLPGRFLLQARNYGTGNNISISSSNGQAFFPEISPASSVSATPENIQNRICISKNQQPESVPIANNLDIGSANFPIQRIYALRDALFVFKPDGIFRITGEDILSFRSTLLDNTAVIKEPDTVVPLNNQLMLWADQGVISVSDNGVQVLSRPIEGEIIGLDSFKSFGVAYESERSYFLFTKASEDDDYPTQAFVYNVFTQTWTKWEMVRNCGIVNQNRMYLGDPSDNYAYRERKDYAITDYSDRSFTVFISSSSGTTVTLADTADLAEGMTLEQGDSSSVILDVVNSTTVTVADTLTWSAGTATALTPITVDIKWLPLNRNPGVNKIFPEMTFVFRRAEFENALVQVTSSFDNDGSVFQLFNVVSEGERAIRCFIPRQTARALWISPKIEVSQALTFFELTGLSVQYSNIGPRFK